MDKTYPPELDNCEVCKGIKGGVKGNENIIDGVIMCDYCHAAKMNLENDMIDSILVCKEDAHEFVEWAKNKAFCNSGQHICDRLADQFEQALKDES